MTEIQTISSKNMKFPEVWPGIVCGAMAFVVGVATTFIGFGDSSDPVVLFTAIMPYLFLIAATVYWFVCVYQIHKALLAATGNQYPVSAGQSIGFQFIPFYNVYWTFKWPAEIVDFINHSKKSKELDRLVPGVVLLSAWIFGWGFLAGLTYVAQFALLAYLIKKIREATQTAPVPTDYLAETSKRKVKIGKGASTAVVVFFLIPVIISVVILGVLIAIAVPSFVKARDAQRARITENQRTIAANQSAQELDEYIRQREEAKKLEDQVNTTSNV